MVYCMHHDVRKEDFSMLTLYTGRPDSCDGRISQEIAVYDFLDSLHVPYQRLDHDPAATMEVCAAIDASLGALICKNLFLCNRQQTAFYLLMMPADKIFKTKELSHRLGVSRLSFADENHMKELLNLTPGSVSVMGLLFDPDNRVQLVIDRDVAEEEYVGCHPCINTSSLRLKTADLIERILPALHHTPIFVDLPGIAE